MSLKAAMQKSPRAKAGPKPKAHAIPEGATPIEREEAAGQQASGSKRRLSHRNADKRVMNELRGNFPGRTSSSPTEYRCGTLWRMR